MRLIFPILLAAMLPACTGETTATDAAATRSLVQDSDAARVANCQFLQTVTESHYSGMLFAGAGLAAAQEKVRATAAGLGGTHVVWGAMASGGAIQSASGSAYRCG